MAEEPATPGPSRSTGPTLQRGKACLRCRKRKMRCDGTKPACQQCQRAKKGDLCEYDDGKGKTRTQILRETISRLEARIKELEDPDRVSSSITLFDPHALLSEDSSSSGADSPSAFSTSQSPHTFPSTASSPPPPISTPPIWLPSANNSPDATSTPSSLSDVVPIEIALSFLDIFLPHQHQVYLGLHPERLRSSLHLPVEEQRHPVLMHAIFLWACAFSRTPSLSRHEPLYLARALAFLSDAMQTVDRIIDVLQGCCLIALYLLSHGRLAEGSQYLSTAASFALQWGLHRQVSEQPNPGLGLESHFVLPPARDTVEQGERVLAFWQVYYLDQCWSVLLRRPAIIHDGRDLLSAITVPWPQDISDYEAGNVNSMMDFTTVQAFIHHTQVPNFGFSNFALQSKAAALYEAATRLSATWSSGERLPELALPPAPTDAVPGVAVLSPPEDEMAALENTIARFSNSLLPVHQMHAVQPTDKHCLIIVHTLSQAAIIRLNYHLGETDPMHHDKCMQAARSCLFILRHVSEGDVDFLDPAILPCWGAAANVFLREIARIEAWSAVASTELRGHVATILAAMAKLGQSFHLAGFLASQLQSSLHAL
ncbi:hypothetical protein FA95DRAFT_1572220 [Auriscalpium vulgare]|uniref:Uncharacterized protein n=1 Tax=Auriscalpium vulgare TaxID=40419 RepID=A0ACB8RV00_9AGAM|nr:hypothetical protein FA95DRAFT_1572220 [Auriscalpium vulgare]